MSNEGLIIDSSAVYEMFGRIETTNKDIEKAIRSGFRKGSNIITKKAQSNLKQVRFKGKPLKNVGLLQRGVSVSLWRKSKGATVGLIDNRKSKVRYKGGDYRNPAYLLRWINSGTDDRYIRRKKSTKKLSNTRSGYRGSIDATEFFSNAVNQTKNQAEQAFMNTIQTAIRKNADKK